MMTLRIVTAIVYLLIVLAMSIYTIWSIPIRKTDPWQYRVLRWSAIVLIVCVMALSLVGLVNAITAFGLVAPL